MVILTRSLRKKRVPSTITDSSHSDDVDVDDDADFSTSEGEGEEEEEEEEEEGSSVHVSTITETEEEEEEEEKDSSIPVETEEENDDDDKKKKKKKADKTKGMKSIKIQIVTDPSVKKKLSKTVKKKKKKTKSADDEESDQEAEAKGSESDSSSSSSESESDDESDPEDEYMSFVPRRIKRQPRSMKKIRRWIQDIEDEAVTVERLLKSKIRKKYKHEIFEWIMIYENTMPLSEERRDVRQQISQMMEAYEKEYHQYKANKKEVKAFEKKNKDYNEMYDIQYKILRLQTSDKNKEAIYRKFMELKDKSGDIDEEFYKLKNWIQSALQLPFDRVKQFPTFISVTEYLQNVKQIFDAELYGMGKVKEQLLLFIHGKLLNPDMKGCCLGLVGDPGVGKTSIARCLARVMDFPFEQITFGGVNSADYIRGFDYTYVGSRPGEIARCLTRMEYKNGIIFFDEYEKISQNKDITACLLHVTDFTQNNTFRDNYLSDLQLDLSSLWFIYSMNSLPEDEALKDRMFCITVEGYKEVEKIRILCDYLLGKHLKNLGLKKTDVVITDDIARELILKVCPNDKGIRTMEKHLKDLLSKISFLVSNQDVISCSFSLPSKYLPMTWPITVTTDMLSILLKDVNGTPKHLSMYS